jgi:hypothetical protein
LIQDLFFRWNQFTFDFLFGVFVLSVDFGHVFVKFIVSEKFDSVLVLLIGGKGFDFVFFKSNVIFASKWSAEFFIIALLLTFFIEDGLFSLLSGHFGGNYK